MALSESRQIGTWEEALRLCKPQARLTRRYRALTGRGKRSTVAVTAVARELVGFTWAIARMEPAAL